LVSTFSHGRSAKFWKTIADFWCGPVTRAPSMVMRPSVGLTSPPTARISVVFPQPEGPMTVMNSFFLIVRLTSFRATVSPRPSLT